MGNNRTIEPYGNGGFCAIENITLGADNWLVTVKSLSSTSSTIRTLRDQGGFGLTHVGQFFCADGSDFSGAEASQFLIMLNHFLSFARGAWVEPVCPVGFNRANERVWAEWSTPHNAWNSNDTWFDAHHATQLETLFPLFLRLWQRPGWHDTLHEVLYWHLNANDSHRGIDPGIILTQNALERLAFEYVVRDRGMLESQGFKDLRASDKLRLLLASLDIPVGIPEELTHLRKLADQRDIKWKDLPHALTEFRNSLVHPDHKHRNAFENAHYEAWCAGLWLIDLTLLRLCGYQGTYGNRLKRRTVGHVEQVPWQKAGVVPNDEEVSP